MYIFVLVIHVIVSLVLVAVILLQAGKGGGLSDTFGGGGGSSQTTIFGQKASDFLTKATEVCAVLFLCTSLSLAFLSGKRKKSIMENAKIASPAQEAKANETVTVKEVKVDPETGKETVVKETTRPVTEEDKKNLQGK